jgi:hypothetical protein
MLLALALIAALPDLVPMRWISGDPGSLDLLKSTPVNCVLIEPAQWSETLNKEAANRGIAALAVIRPGGAVESNAQRARELRFAGGVLEGSFSALEAAAVRRIFIEAGLPLIELTLRSEMNLDGGAPVIGTFQGVWPGIHVEEAGDTKAGPSGAPWIDTNAGFLRFVRASTASTVWIANTPPTGKSYPGARYIQVIGDAAIIGARWVVALDAQFHGRLLAGETRAVEDWKRIAQVLEFYESHKEWRTARPFARLAIVEDVDSGAMLSGGILDMIAVKHTPVRPVRPRDLTPASLAAAQMAVNVDPESLTASQKEALGAFTRAGGTLLTGPPGWKFPQPRKDQITLEKEDLKKLDDIWREMNSMTGRRNLGARLFNVSSMLSNVVELPERGNLVVHLVNYSDFPVENVTVHVLGTYKTAELLEPGRQPVTVETYKVDDGTGFDIPDIKLAATLLIYR